MIYMQFLVYESARRAVNELIEFQPNQAESIVNILCSELVTFPYLQTSYQDDYHGPRLRLRCEEYTMIVPQLYCTIMAAEHPNWNRAKSIARELMRRYRNMCAHLHLEPRISDERIDVGAVRREATAC